MAETFPSPDKMAHPTIPGLAHAPPIATAHSEDPLHELRVRIPVDLHRQLLSLKVLRGKSLAETVSTALDIYFQEHARKSDESVTE